MYDLHHIDHCECRFCEHVAESMTALVQHVAQEHPEKAAEGERMHRQANFDNVVPLHPKGSQMTVGTRRS